MKDLIVGLERMGALESMSSDQLDAAIRALMTSFSTSQSTNIDIVTFIRCIRGIYNSQDADKSVNGGSFQTTNDTEEDVE